LGGLRFRISRRRRNRLENDVKDCEENRLETGRFMNLASAEKEKIVEICERNDIEFCAVFGSFARGEATETSDIDLLVRFSKPKGWDWINAALEIEEALGRKVDLATENMIGKYIRESVFRDLKVIYDKSTKTENILENLS
jgi:uncharacterized protein